MEEVQLFDFTKKRKKKKDKTKKKKKDKNENKEEAVEEYKDPYTYDFLLKRVNEILGVNKTQVSSSKKINLKPV